jgi:hypothetical protein
MKSIFEMKSLREIMASSLYLTDEWTISGVHSRMSQKMMLEGEALFTFCTLIRPGRETSTY